MEHNALLPQQIAAILDKKGADNIEIYRVDHMTSITDYFVIATGRNAQAVHSLGDDLMEQMNARGIPERRSEGLRDGRWIVVDYASVIVHIFHPEEREYYNIERLWADGTNGIEFTREPIA